MSAKVPAKSILKQPAARKTPTATDEQKAQVEKDRKNLQIALKHAYLIQHRKDVEAAILDSIVTLIDVPAASRHTPKEAATFVSLITAFQPSDYDSLIEERCVSGRCGYGVCANPPRSRSIGESAAWKLARGMGDWCSDACAKKGLYVKTQLSEVPAWERVPEQQPHIRLFDDDRLDEVSAARRANRTARVDEWRQSVDDNEELARERGEKTTSMRPNQVMSDVIVEKTQKSFKARETDPISGDHRTIEGYQPRRLSKSGNLHDDSNEENDDDD